MSLKNEMYVQLYDEYDEHRKQSSAKIDRLEKENADLKERDKCLGSKFDEELFKLAREIIALRKERDVYKEALEEYQSIGEAKESMDSIAHRALSKGAAISGTGPD